MPDTFRKVLKDKNFTAFDNGIFRDQRISLKAKGLLCTALSLPPDWAFSVRGLASICKEGRDAIASTLSELEEAGYLRREQVQGHKKDGTFGGTEYVFFEIPGLPWPGNPATDEPATDEPATDEPATGEPATGEPYTGEPYTENPPQLNNKQVINKQDIPPISPSIACASAEAPYPAGAGRDSRVEPVPPVSPPPASGGKRNGKRDKPGFSHEHEAYRCAKYLDGEICKRLPKKQPATEETLQSWAADFDKCQRIDGYDWKTVMDTLIFSQSDDFWSCNILSGRKFRGKMVQLMAKMKRGIKSQGQTGGYIPEVSEW